MSLQGFFCENRKFLFFFWHYRQNCMEGAEKSRPASRKVGLGNRTDLRYTPQSPRGFRLATLRRSVAACSHKKGEGITGASSGTPQWRLVCFLGTSPHRAKKFWRPPTVGITLRVMEFHHAERDAYGAAQPRLGFTQGDGAPLKLCAKLRARYRCRDRSARSAPGSSLARGRSGSVSCLQCLCSGRPILPRCARRAGSHNRAGA